MSKKAGARSPKWLTQIAVPAEPGDAPIQAKDDKLFPPDEDGHDVDRGSGLTIETRAE